MSNQSPSIDTNSKKAVPAQRYNTKETAQIEVYGRTGKVFCKLGNLSESGAFLEIVNSNYVPRSGDLVRITVLLRQLNKTHVVDAEIIWARGLGLGISFLKRTKLLERLSGRVTTAI